VIDALEFDDSRRRDSRGDFARVLDRDRLVLAVHDEGDNQPGTITKSIGPSPKT
jgi:hypothetical protein